MSELYYAEMEAARNSACDAYFEARPQIDKPDRREMFKAGFERAFVMLWVGGKAVEETRAATETEATPVECPKSPTQFHVTKIGGQVCVYCGPESEEGPL